MLLSASFFAVLLTGCDDGDGKRRTKTIELYNKFVDDFRPYMDFVGGLAGRKLTSGDRVNSDNYLSHRAAITLPH
jgi:hypothetical protein